VTGAARRSSGAFAATAAASFSLRCFPVISQSCLLFKFFVFGIQQEDFHQQTRLNFEEETNEVVRSEDSFVWC
jgi:hypothetical protein